MSTRVLLKNNVQTWPFSAHNTSDKTENGKPTYPAQVFWAACLTALETTPRARPISSVIPDWILLLRFLQLGPKRFKRVDPDSLAKEALAKEALAKEESRNQHVPNLILDGFSSFFGAEMGLYVPRVLPEKSLCQFAGLHRHRPRKVARRVVFVPVSGLAEAGDDKVKFVV